MHIHTYACHRALADCLLSLPNIALGQHNDNFVCCPDDALTWDARKYLIVQEIIQNDPDVICLQVQQCYWLLLARRLEKCFSHAYIHMCVRFVAGG